LNPDLLVEIFARQDLTVSAAVVGNVSTNGTEITPDQVQRARNRHCQYRNRARSGWM
jgi:hypothetical protein